LRQYPKSPPRASGGNRSRTVHHGARPLRVRFLLTRRNFSSIKRLSYEDWFEFKGTGTMKHIIFPMIIIKDIISPIDIGDLIMV
jgi:hypothetical protein